ncbi:hypothetical protein FBEOM_5375 [Fusarium beomiforme]|uniref:Uncharacterized protein n=1 Tax=Fusarium beomiforme TaxID=44412 RepID=A0A9P5AL18_9HYPO|nr:hypothetical protein FBEOM_5375 [Fusarium beomiforme]
MKSQHRFELTVRQAPGEMAQLPSLLGTKRTRTGRLLLPSDSQCQGPECHQASPLSPRSEGLSSCEDSETTDEEERFEHFEEGNTSCTQVSQAQQMHLQQLLRERFGRWKDGVEYTAPPEDRLPPRKRFRVSQWESGLRIAEDEYVSDDELVVVSHPVCKSGFFHLACPFYTHEPEKHHQCLIKDDLYSIEAVIQHLFRNHSRPLYCPICRQTFDTLIDRDNHGLENSCERNSQKPLEGLTEGQKVRLIKSDKYYLGEIHRWRRIWSIAFPDSEQPVSPYLDRGVGLNISMVRDFWNVDGQHFAFGWLKRQGIHSDQDMACQKALEGLMDWVIANHNFSGVPSCDE